jgi:endonuclease/exonuclease/phosphatase family metal-dependent hydrolase
MERVKVVTLNLWGEQPPLAARMARIVGELAALAPDVVALQEVRQIPGALPNQAAALAAALGAHQVYAGATPWGGGEEGLAILSRHPIVDSDHRALPHATDAERRIVLRARLATPAGELAVFTTHLNYRLTDGQKREDQIFAAETFVAETPSDLPKIWMGDFNATPDSDEVRYLRGLRSIGGRRVFYQDAFLRLHPGEAGHTWSSLNPYTERLKWLETDRRIDYIFVDALRRDGRGRVHDCRLVLDQPGPDGVYGSDHFGLMAEVQLVPIAPAA